jgi:GNAT superfamily N-acetyltransferase
MTAMPLAIRDYADPGDTGFVVTSWLESFHDGSKVARRVRFGDYRDPQRRIIHRLLRRSLTLVACDPEQREHLLGFVVGERAGTRLVLHYVYVRQTRRQHGCARMLLDELARRLGTRGITYTHETFVGERIIGRHIKAGLDARWNPFLVWGEEAA